MNEQEVFQQLLNKALDNKTDTPPQNPNEFDIYADTHYNIYMCIKGEWQSIGINATPL